MADRTFGQESRMMALSKSLESFDHFEYSSHSRNTVDILERASAFEKFLSNGSVPAKTSPDVVPDDQPGTYKQV